MKYGVKERVLALVLCICMILPMVMQPMTAYSVEVGDAVTNYGAAIGAVAEWDVTSVLLASNHYNSNSDVRNGVLPAELPEKVTIVDYAYDDVNAQLWYKVDAAPGYTWPEEYANYHWVYDYAVKIISENGEVGVFDAEGNTISSVTMPVFEKVEISAESSLQGSVQYQWQIEYEDGKWVDIYGEDKAELTLSIGMLATLLDSDSVNVRCVTTSSSKIVISDEIKVTVDFSSLEEPEDPEDPENPPVAEDTAAITVDGVEATETTIEYDDYNANNELIENGIKTLGVVTTLTGEYTIVWQGRVGGEETGEWKDLATNTTYELSRYNLQYDGVFGSSTYKAYIRVVLTQGETVVESDTLVVTINEHNPLLYYGTIENTITTSNGNDVAVTVAGSLPDDASLSLTDATGTTVPGVEEEEIALALDVKITQNGAEWQPAEGEKVYVSIPAYKLGLEDGQYFTVYHIHDGTTELLGPFKVENGCVTFEIDGFSVVVISTNYGAAIGGVAEFDRTGYVLLNSSAVSFDGQMVAVDLLPAKVVIKNYVFDDELGKLFYEIDAAPGYTWPAEYADLHWCYSDVLTNIDVNGSMGMFDEDGDPVAYVELQPSDKPTYTVQSSLTGSVKYQWQICYDIQNYLWMDIDGQTDASFIVSYAMLASMLDENGMCAVRCMVSNAVKTQEGYPLVIAFRDGSTEEPTVENNAYITVNGETTNSAELADKEYYWDGENGEEVIIENGALALSVNTNLTGDDVTYQWQGLSGSEWVTLSNDKDYELTFYDLFYRQAYSASTAHIRVVVTQGETVVESEQLTVTIVAAETAQYDRHSRRGDNRSSSSSSDDETNTVTVTVQFVMGNNTAPIENGLFTYNVPYNGSVSDNITIPVVQGYAAYLEDDRDTVYSGVYELNETNVTENKVITFRFWPAEVDYKVVYMQQNVSDDGYTDVRTDELKGLTGSDPFVDNVTYEGFVLVWCSTDKIASDGSTVIEVKYDRLYFKMLFDLDGGYGVQPVYARYGTPVTVTNPAKAGYGFMGWNALNGPYNTSDDEKTVDISDFTDIKIPAEHTNYKAIWKATEAAKVTVIVWGQKADNSSDLTDPNSYAYMSKTTGGTDLTNLYFNAKPGTSVTYNPTTGGHVCGYTEEHEHGTGCEATCGQTEHTHSAVGGSCYALKYEHAEHTHSESCYDCGQSSHTHDQNCYAPGEVGAAFNPNAGNFEYGGVRGTETNGYIAQSYYYGGRNPTGIKYVYYNGTWYRYTGSAAIGTTLTFACGETESTHTHSDACGYKCAGEHTHTDDCYERICGKEEHTHDASCYAGCTKEVHTHNANCSLSIPMESNLWEFDHATPVTVAADGSSTLNVYYRRTQFTFIYKNDNSEIHRFSAAWGSNIKDRWTFTGSNGVSYPRTDVVTSWTPSGSSTYTQRITMLILMPAENITWTHTTSSNDERTFNYYVQSLPGETGDHAYNGTQYDEYLTFKHDFNYTYYNDDFFLLEGFTRQTITNGSGNVVNLQPDGNMRSVNTLNFYYTRNSSNLVFNNYGTTFKNESVLYEAPLSGYAADAYKVPDSLAPSYYQPGSVEFAGWYAAPQTPGDFNFESVTPFDFANSKMPASDLILYAWWKPVSHQVTFYYDHAALEAGNIYTVDGKQQTFPVPHGAKIQTPYTPPKDPTSSYYEFEGWVYKAADGTEILWDFDNSTVTEDVKLYGKWKSTTPAEYRVYFVTVIDGKEVQIAEPEIGMALGGTNKTFDAKYNEALYEGYQDRYYPRVPSHAITINIEDPSQNTFTFYYDYVEYTSYTVKYLEAGTDRPMSEIDSSYPAEKTVDDNTHAMVTETFVAIPGYLPDAYQKTCMIVPGGTNEIIFYYNKDNENGLYTVHYWLENLDGTYTEAVDMLFTGTSPKGSTVTAPTDTVIENYYYYAEHPDNVTTGEVSIDAITHLHLYYKRTVHGYTVQYLEAGTNDELAPEKAGAEHKWGTLITESAIAIENYSVVGDTNKTIEISVDEEKNLITFYYAENKVTINYVVVGPDGTQYGENQTWGELTSFGEPVKISSGNAVGSEASAISNLYRFVGWYTKNDKGEYVAVTPTDGTVSGNKFTPTKAENTLWVDGTTYYALFEYYLTSLTIIKDGAEAYKDIDPNQTFVFNIKGDGVDVDVTVHGSDWTVVIEGLTVGQEYTVTEKTDWSWRYGCTGWKFGSASGEGNTATVKLGVAGNTITFTNKREESQWLDGDSWCDNIFK